MQIIAEKRVLAMSAADTKILKTIFVVQPGETVEELLHRAGMDGKVAWHYDQTEIRLKLINQKGDI